MTDARGRAIYELVTGQSFPAEPTAADEAKARIAMRLYEMDAAQAGAASLPTPYYDHGGITIYHADCREILPLIEADSIGLILTDPPYGHNNNNGDLAHCRELVLGKRKGEPAPARPIANDGPEANELVRWMFVEARRLLRPGCCCCCCGGGGGPDPQFARWALWLDKAVGFKQMVVWDKMGLGMGWHYRRNYEVILVGEKPGAKCNWHGGNAQANLIRIPKIIPSKDDHPTPKPLALMATFVRLHSEPGQLVLDPFMGAGTTLRAAKDLGRRAIGIEVDEQYCETAAKLLAQEVLL